MLTAVRHALVFLALSPVTARAAAYEFTIELTLAGQRLEGTPLAWSASDVFLLGRDGQLWSFAPGEAVGYRQTARGFRALSAAELRGQLLREFGAGFEVSGTGQYLVVHPAGQRKAWAPRFDQLYRSFLHYFTARSWRPEPPPFPLVAVVFAGEADFRRYAAQQGLCPAAGTLGFYSPTSNRTLLYDAAAGNEASDWRINAETILHEAAHQVAFNTGIHHRFAPPPRWVAEGLGTLFEVPGVWDGGTGQRIEDRIQPAQLASFHRHAAGQRLAPLGEFLADDRLFVRSPNVAYAQAWALTFFLAETMPRKYIDYLRVTAARNAFTDYPAASRVRDFEQIFGDNLPLLEARLLRYLAELPIR